MYHPYSQSISFHLMLVETGICIKHCNYTTDTLEGSEFLPEIFFAYSVS